MGLIDDKKNVFTTIGAYVSLRDSNDLPENNNSFSSVNNKKNISSFLIDVLGIVVGTTALKQLTGELFSNFLDSSEPTMKNSMKNQTTNFNSGSDLPQSFKNNGIDIPVSEIDTQGKLKNNPNTVSGDLIYGDNSNSFDRKARNSIQNEGNFIQHNNMLMRYNSHNDTFTFKSTPSRSNDNVGTWLGTMIDNSEFINKKEFTSNVLDNLFGTISSTKDRTIEEFFYDLKLDKLLEKMINDEEPIIDENENSDLYKKANELKTGLSEYDMGCGVLNGELSLNDISNLVNNIANSSDPNEISNNIDNTIMKSFEVTDEENVSDENQETIRNGFFYLLISLITLGLCKSLILTPQARMLLALSSSFQNNGNPQTGDPEDDMLTFKTVINCIIKDILASLHEFIYNLIITVLIELLTPIIKRIVREKINAYINIIKSLVNSTI